MKLGEEGQKRSIERTKWHLKIVNILKWFKKAISEHWSEKVQFQGPYYPSVFFTRSTESVSSRGINQIFMWLDFKIHFFTKNINQLRKWINKIRSEGNWRKIMVIIKSMSRSDYFSAFFHYPYKSVAICLVEVLFNLIL